MSITDNYSIHVILSSDDVIYVDERAQLASGPRAKSGAVVGQEVKCFVFAHFYPPCLTAPLPFSSPSYLLYS